MGGGSPIDFYTDAKLGNVFADNGERRLQSMLFILIRILSIALFIFLHVAKTY